MTALADKLDEGYSVVNGGIVKGIVVLNAEEFKGMEGCLPNFWDVGLC